MSDVRKQSGAVAAMVADWQLMDDLLGGTAKMRAAGTRHLPKWPNEDQKSYDARLATATLFPATARTVEVLSAKPFSKPLTLSEDMPERVKAWTQDIDLQGRNLHAFAASLCENAMGHGLCGILVDYPPAAGVRTQADEQSAGVRPYWVHIKPQNILGWRAEIIAGKWVLQQLRLLESVTEPDGLYGEATIEQVRVLEPGKWTLHRKVKAANVAETWAIHDSGTSSLNVIPFVPVYGKREGFMKSRPPLLELAYMNVEHWQSKSDQQTILHVARVPILALIGVDEKFELSVGASTALNLPKEADAKFVEHGGAAIEAGRKSLLDLEDRMRQAGAELLVIKSANQTQVQTLADNEQGMCAMQRIALDLNDALNAALDLTALWVKEPTAGTVSVFKDFGALTLAEASAELLLKMNMAGKLSDETTIGEFKRRGILSPDLDVEAEQTRISEQAPALGTVGNDDDN